MEGVQEAALVTQPLPQLRSRLEIRTIEVPAGKPVSLPAEYEGADEVCPAAQHLADELLLAGSAKRAWRFH